MVNPKTSYWIHESECLGLMVWKGCLNQPFWGWGHSRLLRENVTHMSWKHVLQRRTNYGRGSCSVSLFQADSMAGSKVTMYEVFIGHPCKGLLPPKKRIKLNCTLQSEQRGWIGKQHSVINGISFKGSVFFFVCCGAYAAWKVAYAVVFCLELLTRVVTQGFFTSRSEEVSFEATLFIVPEVASLPFILAFCGFISFHFGLLWLHLLLWGTYGWGSHSCLRYGWGSHIMLVWRVCGWTTSWNKQLVNLYHLSNKSG